MHSISDLSVLYCSLDKSTVENILFDKFDISGNVIISEGWKLLDDLDYIEFIMEIEKTFNIAISDILAEYIYDNITLSDFLINIVSYNRNEQLKKLGIY